MPNHSHEGNKPVHPVGLELLNRSLGGGAGMGGLVHAGTMDLSPLLGVGFSSGAHHPTLLNRSRARL